MGDKKLRKKEEILESLAAAVVEMDEEGAVRIARKAVESGVDAYEAIMGGLVKGMDIVGQKYEEEEYFIPEVLLASDAMNAGIAVLKPLVRKEETVPYKAVIGVIQGDTHDIGKNLVKIMLEAGGFQVIDLGRNVPAAEFVASAQEIEAQLICVSTLMSTTMDGMKLVIDVLEKEGIRDKFKVMVGGGPVSWRFAQDIGADGYALDAGSAVRKAKELLGGA